MSKTSSIGIVGARGYVGGELIRLLDGHPGLQLAYASSRTLAGQPVGDLHYESMTPEQIAQREVDVVVLALPNGMAGTYVQALQQANNPALMIDLGADYRFNPDWHYGLPELYPSPGADARMISNPGCFATAMQLALSPVADVLATAPACFGVSGYSGAGTMPSEKNDAEVLHDNLLPYSATGHMHEQEVSRHLGCPVHFMPQVASFFRGIAMTCNVLLKQAFTLEEITQRYAQAYADSFLVEFSDTAPRVADWAERNGAGVGGVALDGQRMVVYCALDNLLKGAAVQALQNINLGLGYDQFEGISNA